MLKLLYSEQVIWKKSPRSLLDSCVIHECRERSGRHILLYIIILLSHPCPPEQLGLFLSLFLLIHGKIRYFFLITMYHCDLRLVKFSSFQLTSVHRYESPYWRTIAATRIQVAWRYRKRRLKRAEKSRLSEETYASLGS